MKAKVRRDFVVIHACINWEHNYHDCSKQCDGDDKRCYDNWRFHFMGVMADEWV
jgi:hypothetical protein